MSKLQIAELAIACEYNFNLDPDAGAQGIIALNGILPVNAIIRRVSTFVYQALAGAGISISFGLRNIGDFTHAVAPAILVPAYAIGYFNELNTSGNFKARPGNDFSANPYKLYTIAEVVMSISSTEEEVLTAGKIAITVEYTLMNL